MNRGRRTPAKNTASKTMDKVLVSYQYDALSTAITSAPFEDELGEGLSSIRIVTFPRRHFFDLTGLTVEELDLLKQLFDEAYELARPVCVELDRRAQEQYDNGGSMFARLYRPTPHLRDLREAREQRASSNDDDNKDET